MQTCIYMWPCSKRKRDRGKFCHDRKFSQEVFFMTKIFFQKTNLYYSVHCIASYYLLNLIKQIYSQYLIYLSIFINIIIAVSLYHADILSGEKSIWPDICPFCVGQYPCPADYFQACDCMRMLRAFQIIPRNT
jgi:hypothetical protein